MLELLFGVRVASRGGKDLTQRKRFFSLITFI